MEHLFNFSKNMWDANQWLEVKSPRWPEMSHWIQEDDGISNYLPSDITSEDMQMGRDRAGESYISMLYKKAFSGNASFRVRCSFATRMAPLLVFSKELNSVHKEHLEVVLYDCGINLWHHFWDGKKPSWKLLASLDMDLKANTAYDLTSEFIFCKKGVFLVMSCNNQNLCCRISDDWPRDYYAGFTACEGSNKFYEFAYDLAPVRSKAMAERFTD